MTTNASSALAAAIILGLFGAIFYFLPTLVLAGAEISPYLGFGIGALVVVAFVGLFWLRARTHGDRDGDGQA